MNGIQVTQNKRNFVPLGRFSAKWELREFCSLAKDVLCILLSRHKNCENCAKRMHPKVLSTLDEMLFNKH